MSRIKEIGYWVHLKLNWSAALVILKNNKRELHRAGWHMLHGLLPIFSPYTKGKK